MNCYQSFLFKPVHFSFGCNNPKVLNKDTLVTACSLLHIFRLLFSVRQLILLCQTSTWLLSVNGPSFYARCYTLGCVVRARPQTKEKCENSGNKPNMYRKLKHNYWVDKMTVNKLGCYCSFPWLTASSVPLYTGHHPFILFFLKRSTTLFSSSLAGFNIARQQQQKALLAGSSSCSGSREWEEAPLAGSGSGSISREEALLAGSGIAWRLRSSVPEMQGRGEP